MEDHAQAVDGCRLPPELDDLALIAAIDGEAEAETTAHLRACPHCAARAHRFAELQGMLRKQFFRMFCPVSDALVAFQQGRLEGDQFESIEAHIADCPHCARELQLLTRLAGDPQLGRSPPDPWNILNATARETAAGKLRRVFAELLPPAAPLAGAYGALRGQSHMAQYAYHAENLQITIGVRQLAQRADRRVVVGLLELDDDPAAIIGQATASLLHQDRPISVTELDDLGNFVLDDLDPGIYRLSLRLPDREVIIDALTL
jgi:anti-sigma factor RsiW